MGLKIYNTLTGKKEDFVPLKEGEVKMYVCGVTVYDRCHIGHARAGVVFDLVFRALPYLGYDVTYVRNFTDVDDKIIKRAAELGVTCDALVEDNIKAFYDDMDALYLKRPTHEPRATEYIDQMKHLIDQLIEKGLAYEAGGDVFYSVSGFAEYGKLSKKNTDELVAGSRVDVNETKKDPLDFALWKGAKPGEPHWPSAWGEGRPGWHIECSAMGRELLGATFDIHGGGRDLIFPHHENEIAQSHGASGHPPVRYWMHNGFVNINAEKMSKSLGNFFTIKDVTAKFDPEAVRLYLLATHYRSPIDFADPYLVDAERHLDRLYTTADRAKKLLLGEAGKTVEVDKYKLNPYAKRFKEALEDDFNSAVALATFNDLAGQINTLCDKFKKGDRKGIITLDTAYSLFKEMAGVLGLMNRKPHEYLHAAKMKRLPQIGMTEDEVEALIEQRNAARKAKDFATADAVRKELTDKGIELLDSATGTDWNIKAR